MGVSLRLICNTCRTIHRANGHRDILSTGFHKQPGTPAELSALLRGLRRTLDLEDLIHGAEFQKLCGLIQILRDWRFIHLRHKIHITNDHGMDLMNTGGYIDEETGKSWWEVMYGKEAGPEPMTPLTEKIAEEGRLARERL